MPKMTVYPRPRGGAAVEMERDDDSQGLSPPTRGSRVATGVDDDTFRVYPRPRGGAGIPILTQKWHQGLSPPTRGSQSQRHALARPRRSIPAHAGEPPIASVSADTFSVYPRPRGGAMCGPPHVTTIAGLSPPTRGSHTTPHVRTGRGGSIPAHAGEPTEPTRPRSWDRVYPRPRGGAARPLAGGGNQGGLSPPTRGSHVRKRLAQLLNGSIPAHAGEPAWLGLRSWSARVYPRPRGGARPKSGPGRLSCGLSPPTRGSRIRNRRHTCPTRVYPRPRGGAPGRFRITKPQHLGRFRSIPAHAGEPAPCGIGGFLVPVYPRPRGGAPSGGVVGQYWYGLSPPTRGSPYPWP